jgi:hypothetical protein
MLGWTLGVSAAIRTPGICHRHERVCKVIDFDGYLMVAQY